MPKKRKMEIITPTKKVKDAVKCGSTLQAYTIFKSILDYEEYELKGQEHFWVMGIDGAGYVTCVYIAAIGSDNRGIIDPVDIFSIAIAQKSKVVVLAHNRPEEEEVICSSKADIDLTDKLFHACLHFGLIILDHIIFGDSTYLSMLKNGDIEKILKSRTYKSYNKIKPQLDKEKKEAVEHGIDKRNIEIAKKLLELNLDIKTIIKATGLTEKEINKLK